MTLQLVLGHRSRRLGQFPQQQQQANPMLLLRRDGALVDVEVSAPASRRAAEEAEGAMGGTPHLVRGMVDTGASISTISDEVAAAAGLQMTGSVPLGGVGGTSERPIYAASFNLPEYGVFFDAIEVAGVTLPVPDFQVLIGRDILQRLRLDYHGPAGVFSLSEEVGEAPEGATPSKPTKKKDEMSPLTKVAIGGGVVAAVVGGLFATGAFK